MTNSEALRIMNEKLVVYGLREKGWNAELSNTKRALGECRYCTKTVRVSRHHIECSSADSVIDTILHEIAHAIDFENRGRSGHDAEWRRVAVMVGATPRANKAHAYNIKKPVYKYDVVCPKCGKLGSRNRKSRGIYRCKKCISVVEFKQNY